MADIDAYKKQLLDVDSSVTNQYTMVKRVAYHLRSRLPSNISTDDLVQMSIYSRRTPTTRCWLTVLSLWS